MTEYVTTADALFFYKQLIERYGSAPRHHHPSLSLARQAGINVAMITGDYPATARAIALQAGIDVEPGVLTGAQIAVLYLPALRGQVRRIRVFARVLPEQKLALVEAFKANGEVLVMTGDGINDAPALEAAHIGIAMGERGRRNRELRSSIGAESYSGQLVQLQQWS